MRRIPPPVEDQTGQNQPTQTKAIAMVKVLFVLLSLRLSVASNPHQPMNLTWIILSATTGEVINSPSAIYPKNAWWPDLEFDLCLLAAGSWDIGDWEVKMPGKPEVLSFRTEGIVEIRKNHIPAPQRNLQEAATALRIANIQAKPC